MDVEDETGSAVGKRTAEKFFRTRECNGFKVVRMQKAFDGLAHCRVVFDDGNYTRICMHETSPAAITVEGAMKWKAPREVLLDPRVSTLRFVDTRWYCPLVRTRTLVQLR